MPVVAGYFVSNNWGKNVQKNWVRKETAVITKDGFGGEMTTKFLMFVFSEKKPFSACFSVLEKLQVFRWHNLKYYVFSSGMFLKQLWFIQM